ncbi:hypothetical protein [Methylocystis heyeri]|uniref:Uncharacterized protein n=1 Tax=Methylocystis heyeri TaxID=391905 RepID=A0A6B8KHV6_9HYPH|nr:hypothetical protein [Methylocystis heyeri]QGM46555.1 hypothetical protein H2LOC_013105 [Methylocystis heyeri]
MREIAINPRDALNMKKRKAPGASRLIIQEALRPIFRRRRLSRISSG